MTPTAAMIYKIVGRQEWTDATRAGLYTGSPDDVRDGFIHLSSREQLSGTLAKHFPGRADLLLVALDAAELGDALRWEPSRGGQLFPHFYAALPVRLARTVTPISIDAMGRHCLPQETAP
jgi:uncharacterized protein (DUF952 family)